MRCKICNKEFRAITTSHLQAMHHLSCTEYLKRFPNEKVGGYRKEVLGDVYEIINKKRSEKISRNANIDACRLGQKISHDKRMLKGTYKWSSNALGRKSKKYKGRIPWNKGLTKYTDSRIKKYADAKRKYPEEIDFELYGWNQERAQEIRKRDNFVCQKCGKKRSSIVHHRDGDHRHNDDSNLVTLCRRCHREVHVEHDIDGRFKLRKLPLPI